MQNTPVSNAPAVPPPPMHAKLLEQALADNLKKFEAQFGEIKVYGAPNALGKTIGFESTTGHPGEQK